MIEQDNYYPIRNLSRGAMLWIIGIHPSPDDHQWKDILGFPIISNHFQYRKCRVSDIDLLLDMPMTSGTESLEFPVQIMDFLQ